MVGVDTAKSVFQVYTVEQATGEVINKPIKRAQFLQWFANRPPCLIGMEACGGSQHWARKLQELGHEVKLMSGKMVKAFVSGNKNDAADARAIYMAAQQLEVKAVAIETEAQQAVLAMHRIRQQLVKMRTAQMNALRGLLAEYGEVFGTGRKSFDAGTKAALERLAERLPMPLIDTLRDQWNELARLDDRITRIEVSLLTWMRQDRAAKAIFAIPGVGLLTATAVVAAMGDAKAFRSGREFAAWLGLIPGQTGSGGKVRLLGMSKRGDTYRRTLLMHGARAVLRRPRTLSPWLQQLSQRRPLNVVIAALANKMARTIWAVLVHDRAYDKDHVSMRPTTATAA
ncbi:IS110 family transposase [Massilia sp. NP310]|uniref:IS110 family transposase n=1 Tax=Massilia sp. NP310 TaxID=2861282 RepID=UPI001C628456|nr:IS110 family transposase [Massilia sp. NP310]QYG02773.1 IS110 family transposase [Massilia sp. NP310]